MMSVSRDVTLNNPMEGFQKKIKNVRCRPQSKGKENTIIEFISPRETHVMPKPL
jgi:hypothetical protein